MDYELDAAEIGPLSEVEVGSLSGVEVSEVEIRSLSGVEVSGVEVADS